MVMTRTHTRLMITAALTFLIWGCYVLWVRQALMTAANPPAVFIATPASAIPFAAVLAYGLAIIIQLFMANKTRLGAVFRPNRGRIIGTLALFCVTPLAILSWYPWIVLGVAPIIVLTFTTAPLAFAGGAIALLLFWYPIACLIISGTRNRWRRFGRFCLMFWSSYAAQVLLLGVDQFRL